MAGFRDRIAGTVRRIFNTDKERNAAGLARGNVIPNGLPGGGMLAAFGGSYLADYLQLDTDLLTRYADYSEMDTYPLLSCISGKSLVFTTEYGYIPVQELAEKGGSFHVLAYDKTRRSIVPAKATKAWKTGETGHSKPMVRVILDSGACIACTSDHLFMTKDEQWVAAGDLTAGQRIMPGVVVIRTLQYGGHYWQIMQPHTDSELCTYEGKKKRRREWLHRLIGEELLGATDEQVVHHEDHNSLNNDPGNLKLMTPTEHAKIHLGPIDNTRFFPEWTPERRKARSRQMLGNTFSRGLKHSDESKQKMSDARKGVPKSEAHRKNIGDAHRIWLDREKVESMWNESVSIVDLAEKLNVSWSTAKRNLERHDLINPDANHRVQSVIPLETREAIYDIEVPGYANFVCNGVVIHNSALDLYADEATQTDSQTHKVLSTVSKDENVRIVLDDLFHNTLRLDEDIWSITRSLCKDGNNYEELLVSEEGVIGLNHLPSVTMRRVEGRHGDLLGFLQDFNGRTGFTPTQLQDALVRRLAARAEDDANARSNFSQAEGLIGLEDWEVSHFRMRSTHRRSLYGHSALESARWIYKRLMLMEDSALLFRVQRAPEKYAFYVDVGDIPPNEALAYMNKVKQSHKKRRYIDPTTQKMSLRWEPMPVSASTPIPLLDGRIITIAEMALEHAAGKKHWVYSIDPESKRSKPGEVEWVGQARTNAPTIRLTLDDGNHVDLAPDHPVMRRDGTYVHAEKLLVGESVMPFYTRVSSTKNGQVLDGYEQVYDVRHDSFQYTHRMVGESLGLIEKRDRTRVLHHADFTKRNNAPDNLKNMLREDHSRLHREAMNAILKANPELDIRMRKESGDRLRKYCTSEAHSKFISERNRKMNSRQYLVAYTYSPRHAEHNEIRRAASIQEWATPEIRAARVVAMTVKYPPKLLKEVASFLKTRPLSGAEDVVRHVNGTPKLLKLVPKHPRRRGANGVHRHLMLKLYRAQGFESFEKFKESVVTVNHKVVAIEVIEPTDQYCMTVKEWHNFALYLRKPDGEVDTTSGIYVKNSGIDDVYIPVRNGQSGAKIEVLQSPAWQSTEDLTYFRDLLMGAIKIPPSYLTQSSGTVNRNSLSQLDVMFSRVILRVQREVRNGLKKIARTHLAALGIDPNEVEYDIQMTSPSAIFELAQLEVRNARADLASRMQGYVSLHYVLSQILGLSEEEILTVMDERQADVKRDMETQAAAAQGAGLAPPGAPPGPQGPAPQMPQAPPEQGQGQPQVAAEGLTYRRSFKQRLYQLSNPLLTEEELFRGSETDRNFEGKVQELLKRDHMLVGRLDNLQGLIKDIHGMAKRGGK